MTVNWRIIIPVGLLAAALIVIAVYLQTAEKAPQVVQEEAPAVAKKPVVLPPAPTANIDDAVAAFFAEAALDEAAFAELENDLSLLQADSQAISDFGQSYNEADF